MVVGGEDDGGLEQRRLVGCHQCVRHDDDGIAYVYEVRCGTVDADAPGSALPGDDVCLETRTVIIIHHLHTLTGIDISRLHQRLVDRDAAYIIKVRLGDTDAVDLGFEYVQ